jgi:hypothetical protein
MALTSDPLAAPLLDPGNKSRGDNLWTRQGTQHNLPPVIPGLVPGIQPQPRLVRNRQSSSPAPTPLPFSLGGKKAMRAAREWRPAGATPGNPADRRGQGIQHTLPPVIPGLVPGIQPQPHLVRNRQSSSPAPAPSPFSPGGKKAMRAVRQWRPAGVDEGRAPHLQQLGQGHHDIHFIRGFVPRIQPQPQSSPSPLEGEGGLSRSERSDEGCAAYAAQTGGHDAH